MICAEEERSRLAADQGDGGGCCRADCCRCRLEDDDKLTSLPMDQPDQNNDLGSGPEVGQSQQSPHSTKFNRLDPNRRSFSNPTVNLVSQQRNSVKKLALKSSRLVAKSRPKTCHSFELGRNHKFKIQQPPCCSLQTANEMAEHKNEKSRRKTALGLISFGSIHSTPSSSHHHPSNAKQTTQSQSSQLNVVSSLNGGNKINWRNWFTSSGKNNGEAGASLEPAERKAGSKKFLLRNLKPAPTATTTSALKVEGK